MVEKELEKWRYREREGRYVTGRGRYINDIEMPNTLYCAIIGSTYPHARIKKVDVSKAKKCPGVVATLTGEEVVKMMNPLPANADYRPLGWHWRIPKVYPLAVDKVRFIGEPVAAIAATDKYAAADAAELVEVEYEPLPPVLDALSAMKRGAPLLYEDWGDNIQAHVEFKFGDIDGTFARADRIIKFEWREGRESGFPIEPRGALAYYDRESDTLTLWSSTQSPVLAQRYISKALNIPSGNVKVFAPDIGGGFGNKLHWWIDLIPCLLSMKTGRPVKFFESRYQNFLTQPHQRDVIWNAEVAITNDGKVLGLKARLIVDYGVEGTNRGAGASSIVPASLSTPNAYKLEAVYVDAYGVVTNKSFYCAYRGYGKDKGIKLMERIMNLISRELGIPPEEVRYRNFIQPNEFPYRQISGYVYDSGNYPELLRKALQYVGIDEWRRRQEELRKEGKYIGIGVAFTVEPAGGAIPYCIFSGFENVRMRITSDGIAEVFTGTTDIGQSSITTIAQVTSSILGLKISDVKVFTGSSDYLGSGPWSSRGAVYGLSAVAKAAKILRDRILTVVAQMWEVKPEELTIEDSVVFIKSEPTKRINIKDLCEMLYYFPGQHKVLKGDLLLRGLVPFDVSVSWFSPLTAKDSKITYTTYCSSADIAIVDVDIDTGMVKILRYVTVHDAGKLINPEIVEGQVHGGVAQGIGGALYEELVYNEEGQLLTTSYSTYLIPSAMEIPNIEVHHMETPSPFTELGTKGMGEGPIIGSKVAVVNAVEDALSPFNVVITKTPVTPEYLLKLIGKI